jgi:hypothetical protein
MKNFAQETKICSKCGEEKSVENFVKDSGKKDGYYPSCRVCKKKYIEENRDKIRDVGKKYHDKNRDKRNYYSHEWREKNIEKVRVEDNKRGKLYREKNSEKERGRSKKYHENNKNKVRERKLSQKYNINLNDFENMLFIQNYNCLFCKQKLIDTNTQVDHNHSIENKRKSVRGLLCKNCNTSLGFYEKIRDLWPEKVPCLEEYLNNPPAQKVLTELDKQNIF